MGSPVRRLIVPAAVLAATVAVLHRARNQAVTAQGGILIADAAVYDRLTGWLLGTFYTGVADDIARKAGSEGRVLDVGCGPGHLVARLAERGLDITGIDLDPAMIERARRRMGSKAALVATDAARLPFPDASFDIVVSTLSMHHWADPRTGLAEIARVLRRDGWALIWDFGGTHVPYHGHVREPRQQVDGSPLAVVSETRWRWPGPISLVRRIEARPA